MAGDEKNVGEVTLDEGIDPLAPLTKATKDTHDAVRELLDFVSRQNSQIIRLDVGAAPVPQSQHIRLRVQTIIVNPVTASQITLTVGTAQYPFDGAARSLTPIPFPLVIERGSDMSAVGTDGRIYLIGDPE